MPGLFGQTVFDPATGNKQGQMFDTTAPAPASAPIRGSKNALDPKHTGNLFQKDGSSAMADTESGHWVTIDGNHVLIKDPIGSGKGFSGAELHRKLLAHHRAIAGGNAVAESAEFEKAGRGMAQTTFHKELPSEVKRYLEGNPAALRLFRVTDDATKAGGADAIGDLGEDKYFAHVDRLHGSDLKAALDHARASDDPEIRFAAMVHDNLPPHSERVPMGSIAADKLKTGQTFTMQGIKFRVAEDSDGFKVLAGEGDEFPVAALKSVPVDRGSLRMAKAPKVRADAVAPFSAPAATLVYLCAPATGEFKPAVTLGLGLPKEVAGQPAVYMWKDLIHTGDYTHPVKGFRLGVDKQKLDTWVKNFDRMAANRVEVGINVDHSEAADDARGYLIGMRRDGDTLKGLCQFIGDDAARTAARNRVSVGIDNEFADGEGRRYDGGVIRHVALTPVPVVPGQQPFTIAASAAAAGGELLTLAAATPAPGKVPDATPPTGSISMSTINCSAEQLTALRKLIPGGDAMTAEDATARIVQHLSAVNGADDDDAGGASTVATMSRADIQKKAADNRKSLRQDLSRTQTDLAAANIRIADLSKAVPQPLTGEAEAAMVNSAKILLDHAVHTGGISPATRDRLFGLCVKKADGKTNTLCLSAAANDGNKAMVLALAEVLADNRPGPATGEAFKGTQTLSRHIDGETPLVNKDVQSEMIKMANGK